MQMFMLTAHNRCPKDNSYLRAGFLFQQWTPHWHCQACSKHKRTVSHYQQEIYIIHNNPYMPTCRIQKQYGCHDSHKDLLITYIIIIVSLTSKLLSPTMLYFSSFSRSHLFVTGPPVETLQASTMALKHLSVGSGGLSFSFL